MSYIVTDINNSGNDLNKIKQLISDLNTEQLKLVISASNLSVVEKIKLGVLSGTENVIKVNTIVTKAQTLSEEEWLAQQWLSIGAEEADTVATTANTVAKKANLSITNLLKVAASKLSAVIKANPVVAITAVALGALLAIKKYYDHVEKVRQQLKETAKEAKSAIDEINSNFKTLSSTTNDIKERYAELAQGVENLGKVNQSRGSLSTDDYEEFLDLSNQLAKLFPQLTVGYDDNGNAILNLSGNVNTIVGSLNNLVDVQQRLANQEMLGKLSDVWAGYTIELEEYNKKLQENQKILNKYQNWMAEIDSNSKTKIDNADIDLVLAAKKAGIYDPENVWDFGPFVAHYTDTPHNGEYIDSYTLDVQKLTEAEKNALLNALGELSSEYNKAIQLTKSDIASANSDMSSYINTWLSSEWNYNKMNSNLQNVVKDILLNTNWDDALPSDVNSNDWDDVSNWLQRQFLYAISSIDNDEIEKALVDAFNDNLSIESLQEIISQLTGKEFGFTEENPLIIYLQTKLIKKEDIQNSLKDSIRKIANDHGIVNRGEYEYLLEYTEKLTDAEIELWLKSTQGAKSAADAKRRYEQALESANNANKTNTLLSITETVEVLSKKLKPAMDSLSSTWNDIFTDDGFALNEIDILSTCDTIKSKLDEIAKFSPDFDYSAFEDFVRVLSNTESKENDVNKAFDALATSITSVALSGIEDFETMVAALEDLGVVNNELVAFDALIHNTDALKESGLDLVAVSQMETDEANSIIAAFADEVVAAENLDQAIAMLTFQKELYNLQKMNTYDEVANLRTLAENVGYTGEVIKKLTEIEEIYQAIASGVYGTNTQQVAMAKTRAEKLLKEIAEVANDIEYKPKVDFNGYATADANRKSFSSSSKDFEETFDWIETAIDRIERSISNLDLKASSVYRSWSERNSNLKAELLDVKKEIDIQTSGYNRYLQQAASVGLSEEWASRVRNGQLDSSIITDEGLAKQIKEYQDYYEKAIACQDAVESLRESVSKLYETAFDNLVSQFDSIMSVIENSKSMLDAQMNRAEEQGYIANVAYYEALIKVEQKNIEQLTKERISLQSALADAVNSSAIAEGSQEWADMVKQIDDITLSIEDANTAMIKYGNSIRDIQWQIFDLIQDRISRISSESDFLINLLSNDKQYNDKGQLTETGLSTVGLHGMNYNVYMAQADQYAQEMLRIDRELARDPYNQDLANRRQELLELQQEMIIAAEDEKQAIVDMVEEGINLELNALKDLIDTYTEALDAQKDLYDYQKNIAEQTEEIASLQKQLSAYEGDLSEEARAKVQQLKVSLENAKEQLEETEYERYISDQKKLLDELYLEYETALNQRLDNIDALIADMIAASNANTQIISDVLSSKADAVGYYLSESMEDTWNTNTDSVLDALAMYDSNVSGGFAAVNTSVGEVIRGVTETVSGIGSINTTINSAISAVIGNMQAILNKIGSISAMQSASAASSYYGGSGDWSSDGNRSGANTSASGNSSGNSGFFIAKKDNYPKGSLNINTSIIDRLKYYDFDSSFSARKMYYSKMGLPGTYTGTDAQNTKMLEWMKLNGYQDGVYNLKRDEWAWTQEGGQPEVILNPDGSITRPDGSVLTPLRQGDSVLNADATKNLFSLASNPQNFMREQMRNMTVPSNTRPEAIHNDIQLSIELPNVQNYEQFKYALQHDRQFEKVIQAMSTGQAAGGSSLKKYKC